MKKMCQKITLVSFFTLVILMTLVLTCNHKGYASGEMASLSNLDIGVTLTPGFSKEVTSYSASVGSNTTSISITATPEESSFIIQINSQSYSAGQQMTVPLAYGENTVLVDVTNSDGTGEILYTIAILRYEPSNAMLASINVNGQPIDGFDKDTTEYAITFDSSITSAVVAPIAQDENALVSIQGINLSSSLKSMRYELGRTPSISTIVVTSADGSVTKTYTIALTRTYPKSTNATLVYLELSNGILSPWFESNAPNQHYATANLVTKTFKVKPSAQDAYATVRVNGQIVTSNTYSQPVTLKDGIADVTIEVTAEDGVTKNVYTISATQAPDSWQDIKPDNNPSIGNAKLFSYARDGGNIYAAWTRDYSSKLITYIILMKYDGATWSQISQYQVPSGKISELALDVYEGKPYIAYCASYTTYYYNKRNSISVISLDANQWESIGNSEFSQGQASQVSIKVHAGIPYVAFYDDNDYSETTAPVATVMKLQGSEWQTVGQTGFTPSNTSALKLFLGDSVQYVGYTHTSSDGLQTWAIVMRFDGTHWVQIGSELAATKLGMCISGSTPYLSCSVNQNEDATDWGIHVYRLENEDWVQQGPVLKQHDYYGSDIAVENASVYVAGNFRTNPQSVSYSLSVVKLVDGNWENLNTSSLYVGGYEISDLAISDGVPSVFYKESTGAGELMTLRNAADSTLSAIHIENKKGEPIFTESVTGEPETTTLRATVPGYVSSVSLMAVPQCEFASVQVNGAAMQYQQTSDIPVSVGSNSVTIDIISADESTTSHITLTIIREPDTALLSLGVSGVQLTTVFHPGIMGYDTDNVNATTSQVTVDAVTHDPNASVKINGSLLGSGAHTADVELTMGKNDINVEVISAGGGSSQTYHVTIDREPYTWQEIGTNITDLEAGCGFDIDVSNGTPYLAYISYGSKLTLMKCINGQWQRIAYGWLGDGIWGNVSLSVCNDTAYVAFVDSNGTKARVYKSLPAGSWELLGQEISLAQPYAFGMAVQNGLVSIAYEKVITGTPNQFCLALTQYIASSWQEITTTESQLGPVTSTAVYYCGNVCYIAYSQDDNSGKYTVSRSKVVRLSGTSLTQLPLIDTSNFNSRITALTTDGSTLYCCYSLYLPTSMPYEPGIIRTYVARLGANGWENLGEGKMLGSSEPYASFNISNGIPLLMYTQQETSYATVLTYTGGSWHQAGITNEMYTARCISSLDCDNESVYTVSINYNTRVFSIMEMQKSRANSLSVSLQTGGGGTVTGSGFYESGSTATVVAKPNAGYRFIRWTEGGNTVSSSYQYSFTVVENITLKAEFAAIGTPAITSISATGYNSIKLGWAAVTGASGYEIYRSTSASGTYTKVTDTTGLNYTNTGLNTGTTYYYKLRIYCTVGAVTTYGRFSVYKTVTPVPDKPVATAVPLTYNSIKITWGSIDGTTRYEVYRSTSSTGVYTFLVTISSPGYTNTSVNTGTTYFYKVRAYSLVGSTKVYSAFSAVVSAKTALSTPHSVKATPLSYNTIKVIWNSVPGASKYVVYRAISSAGTYTAIATTGYTYFTNSGVNTGTTYFYKVRAYRLVGSARVYGGYSAYASAKTTLSAPTSVKAIRVSATGIKITWGAVTGATTYEVWRSSSVNSTFTLDSTTGNSYFTNTGLALGVSYSYKIRAYRLVGATKVYSGYSAEACPPMYVAASCTLPYKYVSTSDPLRLNCNGSIYDMSSVKIVSIKDMSGQVWIGISPDLNDGNSVSYPQLPGLNIKLVNRSTGKVLFYYIVE